MISSYKTRRNHFVIKEIINYQTPNNNTPRTEPKPSVRYCLETQLLAFSVFDRVKCALENQFSLDLSFFLWSRREDTNRVDEAKRHESSTSATQLGYLKCYLKWDYSRPTSYILFECVVDSIATLERRRYNTRVYGGLFASDAICNVKNYPTKTLYNGHFWDPRHKVGTMTHCTTEILQFATNNFQYSRVSCSQQSN